MSYVAAVNYMIISNYKTNLCAWSAAEGEIVWSISGFGMAGIYILYNFKQRGGEGFIDLYISGHGR